jgi:hypothetical protein
MLVSVDPLASSLTNMESSNAYITSTRLQVLPIRTPCIKVRVPAHPWVESKPTPFGCSGFFKSGHAQLMHG